MNGIRFPIASHNGHPPTASSILCSRFFATNRLIASRRGTLALRWVPPPFRCALSCLRRERRVKNRRYITSLCWCQVLGQKGRVGKVAWPCFSEQTAPSLPAQNTYSIEGMSLKKQEDLLGALELSPGLLCFPQVRLVGNLPALVPFFLTICHFANSFCRQVINTMKFHMIGGDIPACPVDGLCDFLLFPKMETRRLA